MTTFNAMLNVVMTVGAAKARAVETGRVPELKAARLPDIIRAGGDYPQVLTACRSALDEPGWEPPEEWRR